MSFARPSLATLIERAQTDIESRLTGNTPLLPVSNLAVLARVHAGAVHGLYGYLEWLAQQILPDSAESEWLERHAAIWGITRLDATYAAGDVVFVGTNGSTIPAGTRLRRADGAEYLTDALGAIGSILGPTFGIVAVTAYSAGDGGDAAADTPLSLVSALSGVQSTALVGGDGLTGGADAETDAALRARILERIQAPPHGGSAADYVAWAKAAHPDVTRAWVYPEELGPGTVTVRIMTDLATDDGIPESVVVEAVQASIDLVRPVTAAVTVVAPVVSPLDPIIDLAPNTAAVRAAVEASLADLLFRETVPGGTLLLSHIREAISAAAGETDHRLIAPTEDVDEDPGAITTLGAITWYDGP